MKIQDDIREQLQDEASAIRNAPVDSLRPHDYDRYNEIMAILEQETE